VTHAEGLTEENKTGNPTAKQPFQAPPRQVTACSHGIRLCHNRRSGARMRQ